MAKVKFAERLFQSSAIIMAEFRAHQRTILQLATRYKVGQETMRKFLQHVLGDEYPEIVAEKRAQLKLSNRQSALKARIWNHGRGEIQTELLTRTTKDFTPEELKKFQLIIEQRQVMPHIDYHEYIVDPLRGDL